MRAIFKDPNYNNGFPYLTEIDSVSQVSEISINNQTITFTNGLLFYDYNKETHIYDRILIICTEQDCMRILGDLMTNGWSELSCMSKSTFIDPDRDSINKIKNIIGKVS